MDHQQHGEQQQQQHSSDFAPYPKLDPKDLSPPPPIATTTTSASAPPPPLSATNSENTVIWSAENEATTMPPESNPYISSSPAPPSSVKQGIDSVRDVLGKWGKKVGEATKKAEDLAGNMWQHLKTAPSVSDAAMGRLAHSTKVIAEGGYEKIFKQTFETDPEEKLQDSYACYLSTSAGPVMGTLYLSTAKLAFCSDNALSYSVGNKTEWSYYKVVVPLHHLKAVNTSASLSNPAEKYIQIISVDNHEFWYMGFVNYDNAVKLLQEALQARNQHTV